MALQALYDIPAPAKLNLFLHVVGRRADGYHLLQSPFVLIDWADTLHFECRSDGLLQRHDLSAALPTDDLCLRAARALKAASGTSLGADIHIDKQLPAGAGMGGGSSDAASTLLALNRLWHLNWPRQRLMALALPLGADVPFFVGGDNAFVEGIGERLTPIQLPQAHYMVVKPAASLPTSDIFSHPALIRDTEAVILFGLPEKNTHSTESTAFDGWDRESEGLRNLRSLRNLQGSQRWQPGHDAFGRNDLQPAAEDRCPEVAQVVRWLDSRFGNSRMTGSGSAVFARVAMGSELAVAGLAADDFDLPPAWVGRLCRSLGQHPLKGWVS